MGLGRAALKGALASARRTRWAYGGIGEGGHVRRRPLHLASPRPDQATAAETTCDVTEAGAAWSGPGRWGQPGGRDEAWGRPAWGRRGVGATGLGTTRRDGGLGTTSRPATVERRRGPTHGWGRTRRRTRASEQGRQEEVGAAGRHRSELGGAEGGNLLVGARLVPAGITSRH